MAASRSTARCQVNRPARRRASSPISRRRTGSARTVGDRVGVVVRFVSVDQKAGHLILDDLAETTHRCRDHRRSERLRLERDEPEALGLGRHDADVRHRVEHGELLVRHRADEPDVVAEPDAGCVAFETAALTTVVVARAVAAVIASDDHGEIGEPGPGTELGGGVEEDLRAFQRLQTAGEERHP